MTEIFEVESKNTHILSIKVTSISVASEFQAGKTAEKKNG